MHVPVVYLPVGAETTTSTTVLKSLIIINELLSCFHWVGSQSWKIMSPKPWLSGYRHSCSSAWCYVGFTHFLQWNHTSYYFPIIWDFVNVFFQLAEFIFWHSFNDRHPGLVCSLFGEICLFSGFPDISADFHDIDWSLGESKIIFVSCLRRTPSGWGQCGQILAQDISNALLIFNTSLHLHQIALRPQCSKQTTSTNPPVSSSSRLSPTPLFFHLIVSIWWPIHRGAYWQEQ